MFKILKQIMNGQSFKLLIIVIVLDTIFGILRAIREKSLNSCVGIDGLIRKAGMLIAIIFFNIIDKIINLNLIGFIPNNFQSFLNLEKLGIGSLFLIIFILFEILSIFKNMIICKLPIPQKLQKYLENIMREFTNEIKEREE